MKKAINKIAVQEASKILSREGFQASEGEIEIILKYLSELARLALEQVKREDLILNEF